jgi:hypothetical protein
MDQPSEAAWQRYHVDRDRIGDGHSARLIRNPPDRRFPTRPSASSAAVRDDSDVPRTNRPLAGCSELNQAGVTLMDFAMKMENESITMHVRANGVSTPPEPETRGYAALEFLRHRVDAMNGTVTLGGIGDTQTLRGVLATVFN